jgi:hypothetical protein
MKMLFVQCLFLLLSFASATLKKDDHHPDDYSGSNISPTISYSDYSEEFNYSEDYDTEYSTHPTYTPVTSPTSQDTKRPTAEPTFKYTKPPIPTFEPPVDSPSWVKSIFDALNYMLTGQSDIEVMVDDIHKSVVSFPPSLSPTETPTLPPSNGPMEPSVNPTKQPTLKPTFRPTLKPTKRPTTSPTDSPTLSPTKRPTERPTPRPTPKPTKRPTNSPTPKPTKYRCYLHIDRYSCITNSDYCIWKKRKCRNK